MLNDRESMTALQALSMAGGLDKTARARDSKILRLPAEGKTRKEIPIDLKKVLDGKGPDVPMEADDILFIPSSVPQKAASNCPDLLIPIACSLRSSSTAHSKALPASWRRNGRHER